MPIYLFENPGNMVIQFIIGAIMVTLGLGLFLIGVKISLLPLGEAIGAELPQRGSRDHTIISHAVYWHSRHCGWNHR